MAKPKGTGESSYLRICETLGRAPGWQELRLRILARLQDTTISEIVPHLFETGPNGRRVPYFQINYGDFSIDGEKPEIIPCSRFFETITNPCEQIVFTYDKIFSSDEVLRDVMKYFGTEHCKTFNCRRSRVLEEMMKWAKNQFEQDEEIAQALQDAKHRVCQRGRTLVLNGEVTRSVEAWYHQAAREAIRTAILKYKDVPHEVVTMAIREATVQEIMES